MNNIEKRSRSIGDTYRYIYNNKECSRQDLVNSLGISLPTVTQNLNELINGGYIYEAGVFHSTGGRKATIYSCVPSVSYSLGIDITGNHISIVLIDLEMNIIAEKRIHTVYSEDDLYFKTLKEEAENILDSAINSREKLLGIGVSLPAIINPDQKSISYVKVINASELLYTKLQNLFKFPLLMFNDANSAGLAESFRKHSSKPMIYLSLSSSVGGANMNGQNLYTGNNGKGCEFGHMIIVPGGRACYCRQKGCLDAYCSANILSDFTNGDLGRFFDEIDKGENRGLLKVFDEYLNYLAIAVNNLRMCYDCDIVLGGYVGAHMAKHIEAFRKKAIALNPFEQNPDFIKVCHYKTEASAVGAALYYIDCFLQDF